MALEIKVPAPAKINLNLKVLPLKKDGFHDIESIFQAISLHDVVHLQETYGKGECFVSCDSMKLPLDNTIVRAYKAFQSVLQIQLPSICVHIEKHIPAGGGLGGGSSDAASFVRGMEKLVGIKLDLSQRNFIASLTGSDVFFFLNSSEEENSAALVSGRGEIVQKITARSDLYYLLVFPEVCSSTKEAYSLVDSRFSELNKLSFPLFCELEEMYALSPEKWNFKNSFTSVLVERYNSIGDALSCLKKIGALFADMSGSGSTVFGVFASEVDVKNAMRLIENDYRCVMVR